MFNDQLILIVCITGAVVLGAYFMTQLLVSRQSDKLRDRLATDHAPDPQAADKHAAGMKEMLQNLSQAAAKPFMPSTREKQSAVRRSLGQAGIYSPSAIKVVSGLKVILLVAGLLGGYLFGVTIHFLPDDTLNLLLGLSMGGLVGYLAPSFWLKTQINANQRALNLALPDALDLMVVCVEAGLTVDAAMQRVGQELVLAHPRLSREFGIAHMETRVGLSRPESLRNLGQRTGAAELQSLAAMLIQADRFGTSIAQAMRVHADSLRIKRQQQAEEKAAKASVKMSFPLVLFIFPATFIVLAGPTVIGIMNSPMFK